MGIKTFLLVTKYQNILNEICTVNMHMVKLLDSPVEKTYSPMYLSIPHIE